MNYNYRKLTADAAAFLKPVQVSEFKAYSLQTAPVYLFMKRNQKFVCVKGLLDFFTPQDLKKYENAEQLYVPELPPEVELFRSSARRVLAVLRWSRDIEARDGISAPPYLISHQVIEILRELWKDRKTFDSLWMVSFVEELCGLWRTEFLEEAKTHSIEFFEKAILRSAWCTFLAVHLGHCDESYLKKLRDGFFLRSLNGEHAVDTLAEIEALYEAGADTLLDETVRELNCEMLTATGNIVTKKICQRVGGVNVSP